MAVWAVAFGLVAGALAEDQGAAVPSGLSAEPLAVPAADRERPDATAQDAKPAGEPQSALPIPVSAGDITEPRVTEGKRGTKPAPPEVCDVVRCRAPGKVPLTLATGSIVEIDQPGHPFVGPTGIVTVLPGETVGVEFTQTDGKLTGPAYAPEVRAAERTVTFALAKSEGGPMLLTVKNPFGRPLKYDASIEVVGRNGRPAKLRRSSTCAVAAEGTAYEMWPEAIARVQAENVRLLAPGDTSCR